VISGAAQSRFKDQLLATALLLDRKYSDAIPEWRTLYETASPAGSVEAPLLLAWCYWQTGQKDDAAKLVRAGIIPPHSPDPGLGPIAVRKYVELRQMIVK
jgi:hypothetical protein